MSTPLECNVTIKGSGIDIERKVTEDVAKRIVMILLGGQDAKQNQGDHDENDENQPEHSSKDVDREAFFAELKQGKPSDNALALAAYNYSQYGSADFTTDEIRDLADDVGLTVPDRLDKTFAAAKRDAKSLFRRGGKGEFRPTVHGETYFKATYHVPKGTKQKPAEADK